MDTFLEIFSLSGRANRARYFWHVLLDDLVVGGMLIMIFLLTFGSVLAALPMIGIAIGGAWAALAITVKRFHDLDRSGWHALLFAIPLYNIYLALVLFLKEGTDGPNRYGPDPLADWKAQQRYLAS